MSGRVWLCLHWVPQFTVSDGIMMVSVYVCAEHLHLCKSIQSLGVAIAFAVVVFLLSLAITSVFYVCCIADCLNRLLLLLSEIHL